MSDLADEYRRLNLIRPTAAIRELGVDKPAFDWLIKVGDLTPVEIAWKGRTLLGYRPEDLNRPVVYRNGCPRLGERT